MSCLALRRRNWIVGRGFIPIDPNDQEQRRRARCERVFLMTDWMLLILFSRCVPNQRPQSHASMFTWRTDHASFFFGLPVFQWSTATLATNSNKTTMLTETIPPDQPFLSIQPGSPLPHHRRLTMKSGRNILSLSPRTTGWLSAICILLAFLNAIWLPLPFAFSMLLLIIGVLLWGIYLSSVGEEGEDRCPIAW